MYKETCKQTLQNILKIAYMFFRKGKGHFCPKNKEKKDTSVFSKIQRTLLEIRNFVFIFEIRMYSTEKSIGENCSYGTD